MALYLVSTPIGNLGDLSVRAVEVLKSVDFIACEDTRRTKILLDHFAIRRPLVSLPSHDEAHRAARVVERLVLGESAALVSDAGTPAVSDPGELVVREAVARGVTVTPIPGASAVLAALVGSGLPTGRFHFLGFLPRGRSEREQMLAEVASLRATLVLFESARRVGETLEFLQVQLGNRRACLTRELTKVHETFLRGTLQELGQMLGAEPPRGECTIVVEGQVEVRRWTANEVIEACARAQAAGASTRDAASEIATQSGWSQRDVYQQMLAQRSR